MCADISITSPGTTFSGDRMISVIFGDMFAPTTGANMSEASNIFNIVSTTIDFGNTLLVFMRIHLLLLTLVTVLLSLMYYYYIYFDSF